MGHVTIQQDLTWKFKSERKDKEA